MLAFLCFFCVYAGQLDVTNCFAWRNRLVVGSEGKRGCYCCTECFFHGEVSFFPEGI